MFYTTKISIQDGSIRFETAFYVFLSIMQQINQPRYKRFQDFLQEHLDVKVQKISINAGFTCPNRDGSLGVGGCIYCNNQTFNPDYCQPIKSVTEQLNEGKKFFSKKYPKMKYLAYFQAYTNTYASLEKLKDLYEEALGVEDVVGLIVGTRPDCVDTSLLDYLQSLTKNFFILVEYGMESTLDKTLHFLNRGHTQSCTESAILETAKRNIPVGIHLILGLPGETREDMLQHTDAINRLPIDTIKIHQLQIIKETKLGRMYSKDSSIVDLLQVEEYADLVVDFLERLNPAIAVERFVSQSPSELLIAPKWGLKNYEFTHLVEKKLVQKKTHQGVNFAPNRL
jgi:uncharacterized protein